MLEKLENRYKDNKNLIWDFERDNIHSMKKADMMISDFSGIIFDYTFLCNKPVMYVDAEMDLRPYDAWDLHKQLWQFSVLEKMGIRLNENDFDRIGEVIKQASDSPELEAERKKAKETAWMNIGQAGKNLADYMIKTVTGQAE